MKRALLLVLAAIGVATFVQCTSGDVKAKRYAGEVAFAAVVLWVWYVRVIGASRSAIGEWLEKNDPNV